MEIQLGQILKQGNIDGSDIFSIPLKTLFFFPFKALCNDKPSTNENYIVKSKLKLL